MDDLESRIEGTFLELKISENNIKSAKLFLDILYKKDEATCNHVKRVALLADGIGEYLDLDRKALFFAGLLHDMGKLLVDKDILQTNGRPLTEYEMEIIRRHPEDSYKLLISIHPFSAEIAIRHHQFQENPYPKILPPSKFPQHQEKIDKLARILSLADFYDSITSRKNAKYGGAAMTREDIKQKMFEYHRDIKDMVQRLYDERIFI